MDRAIRPRSAYRYGGILLAAAGAIPLVGGILMGMDASRMARDVSLLSIVAVPALLVAILLTVTGALVVIAGGIVAAVGAKRFAGDA